MSSVYLAGPIADQDYDKSNEWRLEAIKYLAEFGIQGRSPLRGKDFLKGTFITAEAYKNAMASDNGIVARDRYDVRNSNLVLANLLDPPGRGIGTSVEYGWADAFGTPVITVMEEEGNPYDHPFIRGLSGYMVTTLEEGLSICVALLE